MSDFWDERGVMEWCGSAMREMCRRTPLRKTEHARRFLRRSRERFVRLRFRREPQHPEAITELARKVRQCAGRTRAMPGRTRGDAAVRRVVERLFALTVDDGADERPAATSGDDGQAQIPDAGDHLSARRGASMPPQPPPPSVERTVAALKAAYAEERYADVRAAVVAALPRVPHPARFVLRCIEALAHETRDDADAEGTKTPTRGAPSEPLIHLLLEALGATECVEAVRRPVFAATESGTRLVDPEARADAAALLARTFRGAARAARAAAAAAPTRAAGPLRRLLRRKVRDAQGPGAPRARRPPPPPPRTKWTRRVPHPVLIGHTVCRDAGGLWQTSSWDSPNAAGAMRARNAPPVK